MYFNGYKGVFALKKRKWLIAVAALLVLTIVGVSKLLPSYSSTLEANWGISLPRKARLTEVYQQDSGTSFHGDGVRYHVFSYIHEDYIDPMFPWSPTESPTNYSANTSEAAEAWLDEIDVPNEERPNYENCSSWYKSQEDNSEIILLWDKELNRLYIIESFL